MTAQRRQPGNGGDRLERVAAMLCDAVNLLNSAMEEIRGEKGDDDDDGDAAGPPDGVPEQPR
jgi:hypothetical protein